MKKLSIILGLLFFCSQACFANEVVNLPVQEIENTKGFLGVNYDRQDSKQVGKQKIVNDHSFFNINIQIIKEGALFKDLPDNDN